MHMTSLLRYWWYIFISQIVGKFPRNFSGKASLFFWKFPNLLPWTWRISPIFVHY